MKKTLLIADFVVVSFSYSLMLFNVVIPRDADNLMLITHIILGIALIVVAERERRTMKKPAETFWTDVLIISGIAGILAVGLMYFATDSNKHAVTEVIFSGMIFGIVAFTAIVAAMTASKYKKATTKQ